MSGLFTHTQIQKAMKESEETLYESAISNLPTHGKAMPNRRAHAWWSRPSSQRSSYMIATPSDYGSLPSMDTMRGDSSSSNFAKKVEGIEERADVL